MSGTGLLGSQIQIAGLSDLNTNLVNIQRTLSSIYSALKASSGTTGISLPTFTVATLPAVSLANVGNLAFATNGRNAGEAAGAGTGCAVQVQQKSSTAIFCAVWSGVAVTA